MSSCSPQNQAVLEIASFKRKGLNATFVKEGRNLIYVAGILQLYSLILFYIQEMDGDSWENNEKDLAGSIILLRLVRRDLQ